jgi:hypothetical protein
MDPQLMWPIASDARLSLHLFVINIFARDVRFLFSFPGVAIAMDVSGRLVVPELLGCGPDLKNERSDLIKNVGGNTQNDQKL